MFDKLLPTLDAFLRLTFAINLRPQSFIFLAPNPSHSPLISIVYHFQPCTDVRAHGPCSHRPTLSSHSAISFYPLAALSTFPLSAVSSHSQPTFLNRPTRPAMGWFRRVRGKAPKAPASEPAIPTHHSRNPSSADVVQITHADVDGYSDDDDDSGSRFRPAHPAAQFHGAPGRRLATLYISPSETNLYLQALAGLDTANPELPLWSEPAPELPQLEIDAQPIPLPNIPYPTTPDIIPSLHPNRQNRRHGLLILSGDDGVHLSGFPSVMVSDVDTALRTWRLGVASRSNELEDVAKRHPEMPTYWKAELKGKVWRLKGTQELEWVHDARVR